MRLGSVVPAQVSIAPAHRPVRVASPRCAERRDVDVHETFSLVAASIDRVLLAELAILTITVVETRGRDEERANGRARR